MLLKVSRVAAIALVAAAATASVANVFDVKVLHPFRGGADGGEPFSGLTADGQGNFYGTTNTGGKGHCNDDGGCGTVFKVVAATGHVKTIYTFKGKSDGGQPAGHLTVGPDGSVYGITWYGGTSCNCGTVFKIRPDGTEHTLHKFAGGATDGAAPRGGVILDADGNIYGTTQQGGPPDCENSGCGSVYRLTPDGTETILHFFTGGTDGSFPSSDLVFDGAGNLFGTTESGGSNKCTFECGTLFEIAKDGTKSIVHNFHVDPEDGAGPTGRLVFDNNGTLWGTTPQGGDSIRGVIYKVTPDGKESVVWVFGGSQDGSNPGDGMVFDGNDTLYGTLPTDGSEGPGYVFKWKISTATESIVYGFPPFPAGRGPSGSVAFDARGRLYGTTYAGGRHMADGCDPNGCGEVYMLPPPK